MWCRMAFQMDCTPNHSTRSYVHALLDDERRKHVAMIRLLPSRVVAELLRHAAGDELYAAFGMHACIVVASFSLSDFVCLFVFFSFFFSIRNRIECLCDSEFVCYVSVRNS